MGFLGVLWCGLLVWGFVGQVCPSSLGRRDRVWCKLFLVSELLGESKSQLVVARSQACDDDVPTGGKMCIYIITFQEKTNSFSTGEAANSGLSNMQLGLWSAYDARLESSWLFFRSYLTKWFRPFLRCSKNLGLKRDTTLFRGSCGMLPWA